MGHYPVNGHGRQCRRYDTLDADKLGDIGATDQHRTSQSLGRLSHCRRLRVAVVSCRPQLTSALMRDVPQSCTVLCHGYTCEIPNHHPTS